MAGGELVARNIRSIQDRRLRESRALFERYRVRMEAHMRQNTPWSNVTGEARRGLTALTEFSDAACRLILTGYAPHTVFLELANDGKYRIIRPTLEEFVPGLIRDLQKVWTH